MFMARRELLNNLNEALEFSQKSATDSVFDGCAVSLAINTIKVRHHAAEYKWY